MKLKKTPQYFSTEPTNLQGVQLSQLHQQIRWHWFGTTNLQGVQLSQLHQQSRWHSFAWLVHSLLGWCT